MAICRRPEGGQAQNHHSQNHNKHSQTIPHTILRDIRHYTSSDETPKRIYGSIHIKQIKITATKQEPSPLAADVLFEPTSAKGLDKRLSSPFAIEMFKLYYP